MRKVKVVIQPGKLEALKDALRHHPWISGVTVTEVKGYGRQKGHTEIYRGAEYDVELLPKYQLEVVVPDPLVPRIVHEVERALRTGKIGDGKIFVTPVDEAVRVRTGERGEGAL
ncbi:MAG: P-II family nitrogen regulator [Anaeromyxobacter sp.]